MKKLNGWIALALLLSACSSEESPAPLPGESQGSSYIGTLNVEPNEGSPFEAFNAEEIEFILTEEQILEQQNQGEHVNYVKLSMPQIKFVKEMPVWIALELPGLAEQHSALDQAVTFEFGTDEIIPYYMGLPYDPNQDGRYTITNLQGIYYYQDKVLRVEFDCYTMHVTFEGAWVSTTLPLEESIQ